MSAKQKHVVFDVVGTCVSFDAYFERIDATIGAKLLAQTITAKHFGFTWMTAAELEFTFLSISGRYKPYKEVMQALFYRSLWMAGVQDPRELFTDVERELCIEGYSGLKLRPDTEACFQKLRDAGFTVWCLTTGDVNRVRGYFERADVDMPIENFVSCDSLGVAKPALLAYQRMFAKFSEDDEKWFAAAHMWDVSAATQVGFKGAYCGIYEKEPCLEIFDSKMDVMSDSLTDMADGIIRAKSP